MTLSEQIVGVGNSTTWNISDNPCLDNVTFYLEVESGTVTCDLEISPDGSTWFIAKAKDDGSGTVGANIDNEAASGIFELDGSANYIRFTNAGTGTMTGTLVFPSPSSAYNAI